MVWITKITTYFHNHHSHPSNPSYPSYPSYPSHQQQGADRMVSPLLLVFLIYFFL